MVAVVFISVTLLDRFYSLTQYMALGIVISGFIIVGLMDIYNSDGEEEWEVTADTSVMEIHIYASEKHMIIVGTVCLLTG